MQPQHAELLRLVTLGELSPEAPEVLVALQVDPAFREAVAQHQDLLEGLDELALEPGLLEELAREEPSKEQDERVVNLVRSSLIAPPERRRPWGWVAGLAAAGLVAWLALGPWSASPAPGPEPMIRLGTERELQLLEPLETCSDPIRFRWKGPRGGLHTVVIEGFPDGSQRRFLDPGEREVEVDGKDLPAVFEWHIEWQSGPSAPSVSSSSSGPVRRR